MKKASIFTFAALMLITGTLSAFPASGAGISSLVDALVVHYDFNGETVEEALKDKAPKDSVDDDLLCFVSKSSDGESFAVNGTYSATALDPSSEAFSSAITWDAENGTVKSGNSVSLQAKNSAETRSLISSASATMAALWPAWRLCTAQSERPAATRSPLSILWATCPATRAMTSGSAPIARPASPSTPWSTASAILSCNFV